MKNLTFLIMSFVFVLFLTTSCQKEETVTPQEAEITQSGKKGNSFNMIDYDLYIKSNSIPVPCSEYDDFIDNLIASTICVNKTPSGYCNTLECKNGGDIAGYLVETECSNDIIMVHLDSVKIHTSTGVPNYPVFISLDGPSGCALGGGVFNSPNECITIDLTHFINMPTPCWAYAC